MLFAMQIRPDFVLKIKRGLEFYSDDSVSIHKVSREDGVYEVFQNDSYIGSFILEEDAIAFASGFSRTMVKRRSTMKTVWDNYPPFIVYDNSETPTEFDSFKEAVDFASLKENAYIYYNKNDALIWNTLEEPPQSIHIDGAPHIMQYPELPRGCEVTSLAMLLKYAGVQTDKMQLADEIKKDDTPYSVKNGQIYFGNPYTGFVGDMKNRQNKGYGVYHGPIVALMQQYLPKSAVDLTGADFEHLTYFLYKRRPVWVIINVTYQPLGSDKFTTWITPSGEVRVTNYEHSVLIIGYDETYIYFNDPLSETAPSKALREDFIKAWEQMGKQAASYC